MKTAARRRAPAGRVPAGSVHADAPALAGEPAGHADLLPAERRTRMDVIRRLLADGPSTAVRLAASLGVSGTAVRRHLEALAAEGAVTSREEHVVGRRGRGRPARVYLLTEVGRATLPHAYDDLAAEALAYLAEHAGPDAVADFAHRRAQHIVDGVQGELAAADSVADRARVLAGALTGSGYAASVEQVGIGEQLCQHHCPVAHVATKYPQLCEEELAVFTAALGTYAQRLATIARGDSFCTTFIPAAPQGGLTRPVAGGDVPGGKHPGSPAHAAAPAVAGERPSGGATQLKGRTSR